MLQLTEKPTNSLVVFWHPKFEIFTTLFKDLDLIKVARQELDYSKAINLRAEELDKVGQTHLTLLVEMRF